MLICSLKADIPISSLAKSFVEGNSDMVFICSTYKNGAGGLGDLKAPQKNLNLYRVTWSIHKIEKLPHII